MDHIQDFWERYIQIGRCTIDTKHEWFFINSDDRYIMNRSIRTCTWCGLGDPDYMKGKLSCMHIDTRDTKPRSKK